MALGLFIILSLLAALFVFTGVTLLLWFKATRPVGVALLAGLSLLVMMAMLLLFVSEGDGPSRAYLAGPEHQFATQNSADEVEGDDQPRSGHSLGPDHGPDRRPDAADAAKPPTTSTPAAKPAEKSNVTNEAESSAPATNPRPAWVDQPAKTTGDVYRMTAVSDPYATTREARWELDMLLKKLTDEYIDSLLGSGAHQGVDVSPGYIRSRMLKDEWVEMVDSETLSALSAGPVYRIHGLLEIDSAQRKEFESRWHAYLVARRLVYSGGAALLLLSLLGIVFGYLRIDTATKGFYTRRLQAVAAMGILALVAAGFAGAWAMR